MSKKILLSLAIIGVAAAMVVGATTAYFSTQEESTGNTFSTGQIEISLEDGNGGSGIFNVEGMIPGETKTGYLVIKNPNDSIDSLFRIYAEEVNNSDGLRSELSIENVTLHPTGNGEWDKFYNDLKDDGYEIYGREDNNDIIENPIPLNDFLGSSNALTNIDAYNDGWPLKAGYAAVYKIDVKMSKDSGNDYQDTFWKGNIVVDAVQSANQLESNEGSILEDDEVEW